MKRKLTLMLTAFLLLTGMRSWGQMRTEASIDFSEQGYENAQDMDGVVIDIDENVTVVFNKASGNNGPKYYNTGTAIRAYGGNNFIISSTGTISSITLTFGSGDGSNEIITEVGTFESPTWTGSESEVTFTIGGTSGHRRIKAIDVVYSSGGTPQQYVAIPTFSPEAGVYFEPQTVTISCETAGATIHYTLDGSTPTEDSPVFSSALTIDETTTVKAKAWKNGYQPSPVATATYSITNFVTIAEARALAPNEYALVQGIVNFIDGRNVYVQDATGGICLFLNNNTVPSELAVGDMVQAYGKRANYNGLAELSNINGGNSDEFDILSSGNTLPLAVKTITEILEGGADALQCTRVKVESATIGAINTSGNTPLDQNGASINIYKVPALTDINEGDVVDVTGVIGYFNTAQIRVAFASDVVLSETPIVPDPQLTVSVSELIGFDYVYGTGPSEIQSFGVSGENLTHNATVSPSENFEVSTLQGDLFQPENPVLITTPESGSFSGIQIQVRLKAGLEVGTYSEQIAVASEGAETLYVTVTGTVSEEGPTPPPSPTGDYVRINNLSQLAAGNYVVFAARFDGNSTDYYAMSNSSSGKPTGVLFTSATADGNEVLPTSIVDEESSYYWIVGVTDNGYTFTNASGQMIGWSSSTNFSPDDNTEWSIAFETSGESAMVPNYTGFTITNVNAARGFALNANHNFGPYSVSNNNSNSYNFFLDLFVKTEGGEPPVPPTPMVATPTFSPASGTYSEGQSVSIACATDGATIYYSTISENGPWTPYSETITMGESMTIWAYAEKEGYNDSPVASATYTIVESPNIITIAEARALALNEYALVQGIVTFIDSRNVYIQDETAGIDLFLNNNTVPSTLALGDMVQAYGKRAVYNGLVELSDINGNNTEQFNILSSGNTLPLAVKTIAEILEGGADALQCTRVKVESATIGAINTSGNTPLTQNGATINIYKVPALTDINEGDVVDVVAVIGFFNTVQLRVAMAEDVTLIESPVITDPQLTVSVSELVGFDYIYGAGPSEIQSFGVSGENLTHNVTVSPSENFEVSSLQGDLFQPENPALITTPESGSFSGIQIQVRLKAGLEVGTYSEQIAVASEGAETLYVTVTGTVSEEGPTPPPSPTGDYVRINNLSQLAAGNYVVFAARFDENASDYYAMTAASSGKPTGVLFTSATADGNEVLPTSIVDEESSYYWIVGVTDNGFTFTNAAGQMIGWSSSTNFSPDDNTEWSIAFETSGESAMVPNYTGFTITNVNAARGFALNANHNFGPYSVSNNNSNTYNFFLDLFVKTEGGEPPVPPTPTVATPTFSPASGTYSEGQSVSITCATDGATIYYSTISENGPWTPYSEAITVGESMTIWAYAEKEGYNDSPVASATYTIQIGVVTIFNQDWEGEMNGWTFVDVEGEMQWTVSSYQGNHYAYANGYNQGANTDWCISPAFNLNAISNPLLTFRTAKNYTGPDLEVFFSNNYNGTDPSAAAWTPLTCSLSTGSWTWVESGAIDLSSFSGTNCYIGFKYTCEENSAAGWEVDDILLVGSTSDPYLTVTPTSLTGFTYIVGNGPSQVQTFTVSGGNLPPAPGGTSGGIHITCNNTHYEFSLDGVEFWPATITIQAVGTLEPTTVYVRLGAGLYVGQWDGVVTLEDGGITASLTVSGSVTEQPVPGDDYVRIMDVAQLAAGNKVILASRYNETMDAYRALANTLTSGRLNTTPFTSEMNAYDEIIPSSILADEDNYYWTVGITTNGYTFTNANGDMIGYGNSGTNLVLNGEKTIWTVELGISDTASLVPDYIGYKIVNVATDTRAMALRVTETDSIVKAYATSNMNNGSAGEYNFFLDIFMQGEGGTCTVAAPTFDPAGSTYYETIDVTLSCTTDGATIYYSHDSETGPWDEYEGPITVDSNMTIWAYATKEGCNDSPVVSADYIIQNDLVIIFNQDWEDDLDPWHGWTEVCQEGDSLWRVATYGGNHYAYANGYNHPQTIDWLISPAFDLDSYSDVVLTFITAKNYTGPDLEVYFSNDYDGQNPTDATWIQLDCELSQGGWNWTPSGDISLDEFSGTNCYIGFKYQCTDTEAAGWEVDDIMLVSGSATPTPTLTATPNVIALEYTNYPNGPHGPSASHPYTLTGTNLDGEGYIIVTASENFEVSTDDSNYYQELPPIPYYDGELPPMTLYVHLNMGLEVGTYEGFISHQDQGGQAYTEVSLTGTVHSENEPYMQAVVPQYIQGNNGSNNNRLPVASEVYVFHLEPNTTYRYTNQFVDDNDGPETAGAGNVIYANADGFYRSTSPSLATEGGYGEFTTDYEGKSLVWLINEPTANARFTPGNQVYHRLRINDGHDGTTATHIFTSEDYATVLNFGTENDEYSGSAFYVKSNEASMSFAFMYASQVSRPAYITPIETVGIDYASINQYADFYKELVAGKDGWFGGILPNVNNQGINCIMINSLDESSSVLYTTENGQWYPEANTVNPTNGLDEPIFIDLTYDGVEETVETNVKVWSADNEFVIENGDNAHYSMTVYNILGQPMMMKQINSGSTERINHSLASGVYVINLQNNQSNVSVKVIVR